MDGQQRDLLLLRCRDAIEELHHEIEDERNQKLQLQRELDELNALTGQLKLQEKEFRFELEALADKNSIMQQEIKELRLHKEAKNKITAELEASKKSLQVLQADLNKANEKLLKSETFKEVQKTKEGQLQKDVQAFEKQIEALGQENKRVKSELAAEVKRREDLIDDHFEKIQNLNAQREADLDTERREKSRVEHEYQEKLQEL